MSVLYPAEEVDFQEELVCGVEERFQGVQITAENHGILRRWKPTSDPTGEGRNSSSGRKRYERHPSKRLALRGVRRFSF